MLTREHLVHLAWDIAYEARSNVVDVCVKGLRDRIDRPFGRRSLETVRGLGYRLVRGRPVSRLPIRLRLALAFAAAAAVLLTAVGWFGYARLSSGFSARPRPRAAAAGAGPDPAGEQPGLVADRPRRHGFRRARRELRRGGHPVGPAARVDADPARPSRPRPTRRRPGPRAARSPSTAAAPPVSTSRPGCWRRRSPATDRSLVLVVGDTRENGLEALRRVRTQLLVGLPLLVLLTFVGAYAVAGAALRPVEAMRRRASELTAGDPALRLPIPADRGRDRPARPHPQRVARAGRGDPGAGTGVRRARQPRAAHPAGAAAHRSWSSRSAAAPGVRAGGRPSARRRSRSTVCNGSTEDLLLLAQAEEGEPAAAGRGRRGLADPVADVVARGSHRRSPRRAGAWRWPTTELAARADRGRLTQALTNLVGNALEHGARRRTARSAGARRASWTSWSPTRGRGSGPTCWPGGRAGSSGAQASHGAGLGLAIVAAVAEANGGSAGVRDVEGGAEAWLRLPAAGVGGRSSASSGARRAARPAPQPRGGRRRPRLRDQGLDPRVRGGRDAVAGGRAGRSRR